MILCKDICLDRTDGPFNAITDTWDRHLLVLIRDENAGTIVYIGLFKDNRAIISLALQFP